MPVGFFPLGRTTAHSLLSRFGRMCARSHPPTTPRAGTSADCAPSATNSSSPAGSRARTSVAPAPARGSTAPVPGFGLNSPASLAKYDRVTRSWKTAQCLLFEASTASLETFARWGTMRNGALYRRPTPSGLTALREAITRLSTTSANASGFAPRAPTPNLPNGGRAIPQDATIGDTGRTAYDATGKKCQMDLNFWVKVQRASENRQTKPTPSQLAGEHGMNLATFVRMPTPCKRDHKDSGENSNYEQMAAKGKLAGHVGGSLNPEWVEWLQGWPIGWTDLRPLATDRFQQWFNSQRRFCLEVPHE